MATGTQFDLREFNRAMDLAVVYSSKDRQEVANSKMKDWMFKSMKAAPKAERDEILRVVKDPKIIVWWLNKAFGKGGWDRDQWPIATKALNRRLSAISFVKAGFAKAANKFPKGDSSRPGKQNPIGGRKLSSGFKRTVKAKATRARPRGRAISTAQATYEQSNSPVRLGLILRRARDAGRRGMVRDTIKFLEKRMTKSMKRISA